MHDHPAARQTARAPAARPLCSLQRSPGARTFLTPAPRWDSAATGVCVDDTSEAGDCPLRKFDTGTQALPCTLGEPPPARFPPSPSLPAPKAAPRASPAPGRPQHPSAAPPRPGRARARHGRTAPPLKTSSASPFRSCFPTPTRGRTHSSASVRSPRGGRRH